MAQEKHAKLQPTEEVKQMVRLIDVDIQGDLPLYMALRRVKGVGFSMANAICAVLNIDKTHKLGSLSESEIQNIESAIRNPLRYGIPRWMLNRQKDIETGEDMHLITSDLKLSVENDVKRLINIKSYRGIRHAWGLPVRGQRTRSHFRKGRAIGVVRSKQAKAAAASGK